MIEDGAELIVNSFKIHRRERFSVFVLVIHQLVLPSDDLLCRNTAHFLLAKVRDDLGTDDVLFGCPCIFFDTCLHIRRVLLHEAVERHIQISSGFVELLTLPYLRFSLCFEAALL